jgi:outer membrane lipopolysaccharide assembly protein LptE/RlpB
MKFGAALAVVATLITAGCGYHTAGHAVTLPANVRIIAVPGFVSHSPTFRVEQIMTDAVVREFNTRTPFRVIHEDKTDADAVLKGTVLSATAAPLAYDSRTGRAATSTTPARICRTNRGKRFRPCE